MQADAGHPGSPTEAPQPPPSAGSAPVVVLIDPQLGENIGAAARAMLNCGLDRLRLVRPRDGWPSDSARASASGADRVIDGVTLFDDTAAAIADCARVFATTARPRGLVKPVMTPREAAAELRGLAAAGVPAAVLFGPERSGLTTEDVALADTVITAPLNPAFSSLNLAQAVLLVAWEWGQVPEPDAPGAEQEPPADKARLMGLFRHLEDELDAAEFFKSAEKRPSMVRAIRAVLHRAAPTEQEVRTLHGIVTALSGRRLGGAPRRRNGAENS